MIEITNEQLYKMHVELTGLRNSVVGFLLRSKINDFYKNNGIRIDTLSARLKKAQAEFMEVDENGTPVWDEIEGQPDQVIMLEGKTVADFNRATMDIMAEKVAIK